MLRYSTIVDVPIAVICGSCGKMLDATYDDGRQEVTVEPCQDCLDEAHNKDR